jgi:hypothetical protein
MSTPTLEQVVAFLTGHADNHALDVVFDTAKARRAELARIQASTIRVGATVRTRDVRPKYMSGLTGEVSGIRTRAGRSNAEVLLDEDSSEALRRQGSGAEKYALTDHETGRKMIRLPLEALELVSPER